MIWLRVKRVSREKSMSKQLEEKSERKYPTPDNAIVSTTFTMNELRRFPREKARQKQLEEKPDNKYSTPDSAILSMILCFLCKRKVSHACSETLKKGVLLLSVCTRVLLHFVVPVYNN